MKGILLNLNKHHSLKYMVFQALSLLISPGLWVILLSWYHSNSWPHALVPVIAYAFSYLPFKSLIEHHSFCDTPRHSQCTHIHPLTFIPFGVLRSFFKGEITASCHSSPGISISLQGSIHILLISPYTVTFRCAVKLKSKEQNPSNINLIHSRDVCWSPQNQPIQQWVYFKELSL